MIAVEFIRTVAFVVALVLPIAALLWGVAKAAKAVRS